MKDMRKCDATMTPAPLTVGSKIINGQNIGISADITTVHKVSFSICDELRAKSLKLIHRL
jgi:hypothetical protein